MCITHGPLFLPESGPWAMHTLVRASYPVPWCFYLRSLCLHGPACCLIVYCHHRGCFALLLCRYSMSASPPGVRVPRQLSCPIDPVHLELHYHPSRLLPPRLPAWVFSSCVVSIPVGASLVRSTAFLGFICSPSFATSRAIFVPSRCVVGLAVVYMFSP